MRILVTGSRHWPIAEGWCQCIEQWLEHTLNGLLNSGKLDTPTTVVVVHGGGGNVDAVANNWALARLGVEPETHEAQWGDLGKKAGPIRNQEMVAAGADLCLAFWDGKSRGTLDCITRAVKAGIPTRIVPATPNTDKAAA